MKKHILLTSLLLSACSHNPIQTEYAPNVVLDFKESKWMDSEDYVSYVNFFSRKPSNAGSVYKIIGDCDGFPSVDVKTAPGFCVGQVHDGTGLRKPRAAAAISNDQIVLTDMGSWNPYDGKIFLLDFNNGSSELKQIFSSKSFGLKDPRREIINRPHQVTKHTDGKFYVGSSTSLLRFDPLATKPIDTIEILIQNLPSEGLHPLKSFAIDEAQNIYINVGAASNVCHKNAMGAVKKKYCDEAEDAKIGQGQIRLYKMSADGKVNPNFEIFAKGLRNSMALVWDSERKVLLQGENSRDAINKYAPSLNTADFPHDEINVVEKAKHYGWPYCYDNNLNSPEWKAVNCSGYTKPHMFLPAHSAPLALSIYQGDLFPEWYKGRTMAALHGYEAKGHRIVAFKRNDKGLPTGIPQSIVYGWDTKGEQKYGSPSGLTELPDGSMIIIEDMNKKVLRLHYDSAQGSGKPVEEIEKAPAITTEPNANAEETRRLKLLKKIQAGDAPPFTLFQAKVIDKTCYICHGGENAPGIQLVRYDDEGNEARVKKAGKGQEMYSMISGVPGFPPMPPQGFDNDAEKKEASNLLKLWLGQNP